MRPPSSSVAAVLLVACSASPGGHDAAPLTPDAPAEIDGDRDGGTELCDGSFGDPDSIAVAEALLREASGIAASRSNPGVLWVHNDSGDSARLFALGTDGTALGRLELPDVVAHDFEDLASATCPDGSGPCLWVADTGNNQHDRDDLAIYAIAEPIVGPGEPLGTVDATAVWRIPVSYPDAPIDAEAIAVTAEGTGFTLFEKVDAATARVFQASGPFSDEVAVVMAEVGSFDAPGVAIERGRMITGASLHPSGTRLLLRVYTGSFEYRGLEPGWGAALDTAERVTVAFGPLSEEQGEAIGYDEDGRAVWTVSEDPEGLAAQPLHHYVCE